MTKKPHVLVLGGGFAGIGAAQKLAKADAALTLVDMHDCHTFQPMLYQGATDLIETEEVGHVLRDIFHKQPNLSFHQVTVWAAGLQGNALAQALGIPLEKDGRIPVDGDLRVAGFPEVFAVGDTAWIADTESNVILPQLGSVALQSGEHAGENIDNPLRGEAVEPFKYTDKGTMATIGRRAAVLQTPGGKTIKGKAAALAGVLCASGPHVWQ